MNKQNSFLPVGYNSKTVFLCIIISYLFSVLLSFIKFISNFCLQLNSFYYYENGKKILEEGRVMPEFFRIRGDSFDFFGILIIAMIIFAIYNFSYHRIGTKSVYTMKRLKNKGEYFKRCLFVPCTVIIAAAFTVIILNLLYFFIYEIAVPEGVLMYPDRTYRMWRF